ncbi:hypothetical protein UFOVP582_3 [uncultured Caudovirales phage]|uniref:Uncharacterized protein n=1 Tax=uncultured Caudovirales phage TaxID=2100421 RepID=A0A6J5N1N9_9CAUD|nr:hypothetical protein UFOVP582_3 [uncultured Caudovirales phage]CAB4184292.1 hypothetical protein UFOVP1099_51 [uncultured Caudovirales phage]CAB4213931.1 hypothetical protein UFOVP1460_4 [uncultured Caudovirales phage]CAB5228710.1 hypothetical protein UFOVP1548_25 [uncultured Caudovirales phage]
MNRPPQKLNLKTLRQHLELFETELECSGSPHSHIRRVQDLEASIKWLEKHDQR